MASCFRFARQLASFALRFAMDSVLQGGTARMGLDEAGDAAEAFRQRLGTGVAVSDAFEISSDPVPRLRAVAGGNIHRGGARRVRPSLSLTLSSGER